MRETRDQGVCEETLRTGNMFSKSGGAMTKELKRHLEHQSLIAAKHAEELAAKKTKIRLNIHVKSASNLVAVDNRQFSMTSDPYLIGQIVGVLGERKGAVGKTRVIKRTLAPKWDEWLQLFSSPIEITTPPVPPYLHTSEDSDQTRAHYVGFVINTTAKAEQELLVYTSKLKVRLDVFDFDALSDDDPLGHVTISLQDIVDSGDKRRKNIYELVGDFDLKYSAGMNKAYKTGMTGTLHLTLQLGLPDLPPSFHVDVPALISRLRPKKVSKDYRQIMAYKPFHCKFCTRSKYQYFFSFFNL